MKYNATFIRAISLLQDADGEQAAEKLFNALFGVPQPRAVTADPEKLHGELNRAIGHYVSITDVRTVIRNVGVPHIGAQFAIPWIKEFRERTCCGLKQAKDVYDFVRDNPAVVTAA